MSKLIAPLHEEPQAMKEWEPQEPALDERITRDLFRMLGDLYPIKPLQTRSPELGPRYDRRPAVRRVPRNVAST